MEIEEKVKEKEQLLQLVSFNIGNEEFALDILKVNEIIRTISLTKVPNSPYYVEGIINLRGKVITVIDLRTRLGIERIAHTDKTRIIVVEINKTTVGFIVDNVNEVLRISEQITEDLPSLVKDVDLKWIKSIAKLEDRLFMVLDLESIITN